MTSYRNALVLIGLLALGPPGALSQPVQSTSVPPLRVTSDTPEYCNDLAGRFAAEQREHSPAAPEVVQLAQEGQRMCDTGLIRGGLRRLRRALQILEGQK